MTAVDHLIVVILALVQPVLGACSHRRWLRRIAAGDSPDRIGIYRQTMIIQWVSLLLLLVYWGVISRPFSALGIAPFPGAGSPAGILAGAAIIVALSLFLFRSWRAVRVMAPDEKITITESLGSLVHFLPHTLREYRVFAGLSFTAGVTEEIIYRGFVFWYLFMVLPVWWVVPVAAVVFALAHGYQGPGGMLKVFAIGLALGAMYLVTGSIWLPMLAHFLFDALQGAILLELLRHGDAKKKPVSDQVKIAG